MRNLSELNHIQRCSQFHETKFKKSIPKLKIKKFLSPPPNCFVCGRLHFSHDAELPKVVHKHTDCVNKCCKLVYIVSANQAQIETFGINLNTNDRSTPFNNSIILQQKSLRTRKNGLCVMLCVIRNLLPHFVPVRCWVLRRRILVCRNMIT